MKQLEMMMILTLLLSSGAVAWTGSGNVGPAGADGAGISGLTAGRVPYALTPTSLTDSSGLVWDAANTRLGINAPTMISPTYGINQYALDAYLNANLFLCLNLTNPNQGSGGGTALNLNEAADISKGCSINWNNSGYTLDPSNPSVTRPGLAVYTYGTTAPDIIFTAGYGANGTRGDIILAAGGATAYRQRVYVSHTGDTTIRLGDQATGFRIEANDLTEGVRHLVLHGTTTTATPLELSSDGASAFALTEADNTTHTYMARVTARETAGASVGLSASWVLTWTGTAASGAASITGAATKTVITNATGAWDVAVAFTGNRAQILFTGAASTTIHITAIVEDTTVN